MKKSKHDIYQESIKLFAKKGIDNVTMRELASHCNLSLGAFYYHFKNKEDLILSFYELSLNGHLQRGSDFLNSKRKDLSSTMEWICRDRVEEFSPYKIMLKPLSVKLDNNSALSPWAKESHFIRKESIFFFRRVAKESMKVKDPKTIDAVGRFLWLHHLLIIGIWLNRDDQTFDTLITESKKIWKWLPRFLKLPGSKKIIHKISLSIEKLGFWEEYEN